MALPLRNCIHLDLATSAKTEDRFLIKHADYFMIDQQQHHVLLKKKSKLERIHWLTKLGLETSELRRLQYDLILTFKILFGQPNMMVSLLRLLIQRRTLTKKRREKRLCLN